MRGSARIVETGARLPPTGLVRCSVPYHIVPLASRSFSDNLQFSPHLYCQVTVNASLGKGR